MTYPSIETPKYKIGDIVRIKKYDIDEAMIIGITHFSKEWGNRVDGIDYKFVYQDENGNWNDDSLCEELID